MVSGSGINGESRDRSVGKCRYDIGVEVRKPRREGGVGIIELPPAVGRSSDQGSATSSSGIGVVLQTWLPRSGYAPAHQPMFEALRVRPFAHGTDHFELRAQLPIVDKLTPVKGQSIQSRCAVAATARDER